MSENICRFVPYHKDYHSIHTVNFVLETQKQDFNGLSGRALYGVYLVRKGTGYLHTAGKIQPLSAGCVFFTFPAMQFAIETVDDLEYMYITFLGTRGSMLLEKVSVTYKNFYFEDCHDLIPFWEKALDINPSLSDIVSESVLLYTLGLIGQKGIVNQVKETSNNSFNIIKKYIDDHICDGDLSLATVSEALSYNEKYISGLFKQNMGISFVHYVNSVRIQQACTMMEQGFSSVSDISYACGYRDPLYFSKVFKDKMGMSPTKHIAALKKQGH